MLLHWVITTFIVCGGCLLSRWPAALKVHIIFNSLVILQWLLNNNRCILSGEYDDDAGYTTDVLSRVTGLDVTNAGANAVAYILTIGGALVSYNMLTRQ
jgi:hypothetical protein